MKRCLLIGTMLLVGILLANNGFTADYDASGTYSYDPGTGILLVNFESTTFPQDCGPDEVGTESFEVISIGATNMIWIDNDGDEMTWTRDSGTAGDIVGTWALFMDGTDVGFEGTFNEDLTFSVTATSNFECDGDGDGGDMVTSDLWIRAVINTVERGPIEAVWQKGGEDNTSRGDRVIWGHFYASPNDVTWGSQNNPDLFVKIWFDVSGRIDVNYFHVSVPDIEVYSDYPYDGTQDQHGTTTMADRYIRHEYWR